MLLCYMGSALVRDSGSSAAFEIPGVTRVAKEEFGWIGMTRVCACLEGPPLKMGFVPLTPTMGFMSSPEGTFILLTP